MDKPGGKILARIGWLLIGLVSIALGALGALGQACSRVETSPLATPSPARPAPRMDDENPGVQFDKLNTLIRTRGRVMELSMMVPAPVVCHALVDHHGQCRPLHHAL